MKKIFITGLVLFLVGSVVATLLSRAIKKDEFKNIQKYFNQFSNLNEEDAVDFAFDEKFNFKDGRELNLNLISGDVEIGPSSDQDLHVTLNSRIHREMKPLKTEKIVYQVGSQVYINLMSLFEDKLNSSHFLQINDQSVVISKSLRLKIALPAQFKSFKIDTVSADFKVSGLSLQELHIHNVSGDLHLDQVKMATAQIQTVSGDLDFKDIQFEQIQLESVSGDTQFKFKAPSNLSARLTSISGGMSGDDFFKKYISDKELKLGESQNKIFINTVSGDVEFLKP